MQTLDYLQQGMDKLTKDNINMCMDDIKFERELLDKEEDESIRESIITLIDANKVRVIKKYGKHFRDIAFENIQEETRLYISGSSSAEKFASNVVDIRFSYLDKMKKVREALQVQQ